MHSEISMNIIIGIFFDNRFKVWTWGCTVLQIMFCVLVKLTTCICSVWLSKNAVYFNGEGDELHSSISNRAYMMWSNFTVYSKLITHSDNVSQIRPASYGEDNGLMLWRLIQVRLYGEYYLSTVVVTWWSLAYRIMGEWPLTFSLAVSESKSSSMSCETTLTCLMKQPRKLTLCNM